MLTVSEKRAFFFSLTISLLLSVARGAGGAAEFRPSEWDKTLKAAETEGEVAVSIAHEINNPLAVILNNLALLEAHVARAMPDEEYVSKHPP